jgi:hypothetical protein
MKPLKYTPKFASSAAAVVCVFAFASVARAGDGDFQFSIAPYLWFPGISGDATVKGTNVSTTKSFTQIVDDSDSLLGLFARIDAQYDRLGFYVDGGYTRIGMSTATRIGTTAFGTFDTGLADFALTFRALDLPSAAISGLVGGRYMYLGSKLSVPLVSFTQDKQWVDPIIGAEGYVDLGPHFRIVLHGDVGGLGNQLTWSGAGYIAYLFNIGAIQSSVFLGYKAISEDYSNGSGFNQFSWDNILHGPVIGVSFKF